MPKQYYVIRWGDTERGPSSKADSPAEQAQESFGMVAENMAYKCLGPKLDVVRSTTRRQRLMAAQDWQPIPTANLSRLEQGVREMRAREAARLAAEDAQAQARLPQAPSTPMQVHEVSPRP